FEEHTDNDEVISPLIPAGKVSCHYEVSASTSSDKTESLKHWLAPYAKLTPDMRAIYRDRVKNWRMSASSLTSFIDIVYAGPVEFFKRQILRAPAEPETEALAFGDLVHKTFEMVTNQGITNERAVEFFLQELEKKELPQEILQKIREKGPNDLAVSLTKFGGILRQGKAEVNLAPEKISVEGVPVTGKIDHMLIDEDKKTIEIYDFKTGGYHKEKWRSHATLYKYMLQLGFYKLLINNSPTYKKYKVERAHILFVTPDKDEEVYDKIYEFNKDDEDELINLIRSIYNKVESLEFMNNTEIFRLADSTLGIKDIKNFVDKILER
ncbi:MAG: PD-(D/E)XK nuclease family protein, partial [Candidatus Saccharimonadaceae bacterium]|nr:PD-(D/E)XK nuclease family protein [Candidatus Saccharimonadaceae bacterium]